MCRPAVRSCFNAQVKAALIARRMQRRQQQQQAQLREQFTAASDRFRLDLTDDTRPDNDRQRPVGLPRDRETERQAVRDYLAAQAARREAAAEELASLPTAERVAREQEENERCAAGRLKLAESLRSRGRQADALKWLERLVDEYPQTSAADEAREILAWLPSAVAAR
jgi:hypothetical protein